jgi:hypothetical protein
MDGNTETSSPNPKMTGEQCGFVNIHDPNDPTKEPSASIPPSDYARDERVFVS